MKDTLFNYVRSCRQRHALTEDELAFLINQKSGSMISTLESGDRMPGLEAVLALQIVFGMAPKDMFSELHEQVEDGVMRRAHALYERLEGQTDARSKCKIELLEAMARRRDHTIEA